MPSAPLTVYMPERFDDEAVLAFLPTLQAVQYEDNLALDFSTLNYVFPFATLVMCVALRDLLVFRQAHNLKTEAVNTDRGGAVSYLKAFGFFRLLELKLHDAWQSAPGGSRYLPITQIRRANLRQDANGRFQPAVDVESDRLARIVCGDDEGGTMMLSYCFREIIRNAFEHGEITACAAMAQRWYDGDVEIALADRGIGILAAMRKAYPVAAPIDAVRFAMQPGVTSAADKARGDVWDNTGFGLYVISELGRQYGEASILSAGALVRVSKDGEAARTADVNGTIVKLKVNARDAEFWPNILTAIVDQGEKLAGEIPGAIRTASKKAKGTR